MKKYSGEADAKNKARTRTDEKNIAVPSASKGSDRNNTKNFDRNNKNMGQSRK